MTGGYDRGFAGSRGGDQRSRRDGVSASGTGHGAGDQRQSRARSDAGVHGRGTGEVATVDRLAAHGREPAAAAGQAVIVPGRPKPWAVHAGRVGATCAAMGAVFGLLQLLFNGNWVSIPVLAVLLGLSGAITFWLIATVLDVIRGAR